MAARNKLREKWSTKGEPKAVKFDVRNRKIRKDECTSNKNAVDDREILLLFSFHVILNQCKFIYGF